MKPNKAAGVDDLHMEQIKNFGPLALQYSLNLMNNYVQSMKIPKKWRKYHVVALLKPGKEPNDVNNFRPISLLCHLFKIFERLILNRISGFIGSILTPNQAGFRLGKSCCSQILNLTQYIEDGYERNQVTGVALIDLSAAYDSINHNRLLYKINEQTKDYTLTLVILCILKNRRFYVFFLNRNSRWRNQKNGLAQGSVLAPILYNIYSNDQPTTADTRHFRYADNTAIAAQANSFQEVDQL